MANGHGGKREGAGRKRVGPPLWNHTMTLPEPFKHFLASWDGDTPSQRLQNALVDLERFMPNGPGSVAKRRGRGGRFAPHESLLLKQLAGAADDG
jgi:hypothetical protein